MQSSIIQIGNSKGIRIPKALLEESGLSGDVDLKASKGEIKIIAAKPKGAVYSDAYLVSMSSFRKDWDTPEEDEAWAHLQ